MRLRLNNSRLLQWSLLAITALVAACTYDDDTIAEKQLPSVVYTYTMHLDMPIPSFDGQTTRAATQWEDGSQVRFCFYLYKDNNGDYHTVTGTATYQATAKAWMLETSESLNNSNRTMSDCEVRYYKPQDSFDDELLTAVYYGTSSYTLNSDEISCGSVMLRPANWRLHFRGTAGATLTLSLHNAYHSTGAKIYQEPSHVGESLNTVLTVGSNGYTPYIYATFANEADDTLFVKTKGHRYFRTISSSKLATGESGVLEIPTASDYQSQGWTLADVTPEAIDLGLPSGTLWANMNVGAITPEDYGDYFAWGETEPKDDYSWNTYKWCNGSQETCQDIGSDISGTEYDVAHLQWGDEWRMPTTDQLNELWEYCDMTWTTRDGCAGGLFTSKVNGNSIFLPAGGYYNGTELKELNSFGHYWMSKVGTPNSNATCSQFAYTITHGYVEWFRCHGRCVRPVQSNNQHGNDTNETLSFTVTGNGKSATFNMKLVEGGTFMMGATPEQGSDAMDSEKPAHQVTLSSYYIGETEVTQALWEAVMGSNPSSAKGNNLPVETVSWEDICGKDGTGTDPNCFLYKLNKATGRNFRLPTEAEWEFAARGGDKSKGYYKYSGGNDVGSVAWFDGNSGSSTHDVKTKQSNELGLYDMSGNVWEWCNDWYGSYSYSSVAQINPTGPSLGSYRVYRGGSWYTSARYCRVSYRDRWFADRRRSYLGLRLALQEDVIAEAVDLGLPSGVLWANMNVGASSPEDYGDYFAWGETEPKDDYSWSTYKWCQGSYDSMTKYCTHSSHGTVDNRTVLERSDDAASVKWGGSWRMPTYDELNELNSKCTWTWTTLNGHSGYQVKGPNGNSIFLPAAGFRYGTSLGGVGSDGYYWSSSLYPTWQYNARQINIYSSGHNMYYGYRYYGLSVRPVSEP